MNLDFYYRTFAELKANKNLGVEDPYQIMGYLNESMKEAVLHNPSGCDNDEICQILALDGKIVVGGTCGFRGRMRAKGDVISVQNGSYLFSHEDYRKENVGGELFMRIAKIHPNKDNLYAGISHMALGLYRALKFTVFEFPRLIYLRKSRSVVQALLKTESSFVLPVIWLADYCLWIHRAILKCLIRVFSNKYVIEKVNTVPDEVEWIVLDDEHPYAEYHDKKWFEWNLQYSFKNDIRNIKKLFVVRNKGIIEAFFLIKQEFFKQASGRGFKNVYLGSIMEWGIAKESKLTEALLYLMAIDCFDKDVDGIQVASYNSMTVSKLKKCLFVGIGTANVGFKFKSIKDPDVKNLKNWRIRLATSDTLIN